LRIGIPHLAASLAVAAYAGVALASGLDRLAGEDPSVPAPANWAFARNAPVNAAWAAEGKHHWREASGLMTRALLVDPVNESIIGGLGLVRLKSGDAIGADAAFRVSAQRGWRDEATHLYWMDASIKAGDLPLAAVHADALLRSGIDDRTRNMVLDTMMQYEEGRDALATRLRLRPPWGEVFAWGVDGEPIGELVARVDVIGRTGPGIWPCPATTGLIDRLVDAGYADEARKAHDVSCAQSAQPVNDPRFVRFVAQGPASMLDWQAEQSGDVAINAEPAGTGAQAGPPLLHLAVSKASTTLVLRQRVIVPAGTYRITWHMPDTDPAGVPALTVGLDCDADLARTLAGTAIAGQRAAYAATIRFDGKCPAPVLAFWLKPSKDVTLADISMLRIDRPARSAE
jgi:hypothetical protein